MKKKLMVATALASALTVGTVFAQTGPGMMQTVPPAQQQDSAQQQTSPPMGPGMMGGGGYGYGRGMMGGGYGYGRGMMGGGYGYGPGMMDGDDGYGHGMMGGCMGSLSPEDQQKFMDATKDLRKKMHDKQFEYVEAARNPKANKADLLKKRKELWDLQQKIHEKAWGFMKE